MSKLNPGLIITKIKNLKAFYFILFFVAENSFSQAITLDELVSKLNDNNPEFNLIEKRQELSQLNYLIFKKSNLPRLSVNLVTPNFNRSITSVVQPDGTARFVNFTQATNSLDIRLSQNINPTGGVLSFTSSLNRIDIFGDNRETSYLSKPFSIQYSQPIFAKEPNRERKYLEREKLDVEIINSYRKFSEIKAELSKLFYEVYKLNYEWNELREILRIIIELQENKQLQFQEGRINELELLEVELELVETEIKIKSLESKFQRGCDAIFQKSKFFISEDDSIASKKIEKKLALDHEFLINRASNLLRKTTSNLTELNYQVAYREAKNNNGARADLNLSFGVNSTSDAINQLLNTLEQSQTSQFSISVPILDWRIEKTKLELINKNNEINKINDLILQESTIAQLKEIISDLEQSLNRMPFYQKAIRLSEIKMENTYLQFQEGKINLKKYIEVYESHTEISKRLIEEEGAYWSNFYLLESITLYDIGRNKSIIDINQIR